jgi:2'-5' RNA ligase
VTLVYIGDNVPIDVLAEVIKATYSVTSQTRPFTVRTTRVGSFPVNKDDQDAHPVIAHIESDDLHELHENLGNALDDAGVDFSKKFPVYRPHVTLAYAEDAVEELRIPTIEWGAHEIIMWGGDEGDRKLTVTFPLALTPFDVTAMAQRVASRFTLLESARSLRTIGY